MEDKVIVDGLTFVPYLTRDEIKTQVERVAAEIRRDLEGKNPMFLCVLNGAFIFAADLIREAGLNNAPVSFV
ncbi:MAG: hypoxanthine phosphoribosyltransferase, partial [Muribaculaceae bacterium]|nr:hypoxanthine phosphoribosyltransferase [Muribaculaceae bacterium]